MINFRNIKFIKSSTNKNDALLDLDNVIFIGRSNVGKSTLINLIADNKSLAFVSKRPGQTKLLNYFLVDNKF
ncbi:MAG: 50S ribosome-binding GTPase, partial [Bacillales bacterium]|nr:50S ribosome-binding GTPase [Bacillales bacterium]